MKKMMIMAAAIISAVVVNAASVSWATYAAEYTDESPLEGGTYWLVAMGASSDTSAFKVFEDGSVDFGGATYTQGTITDAYGVMGEINGLTAANNGDYYALVIWDGKNAADGGLYGVSSAVAVSGIVDAPPTNGDGIDFNNGTDSFGTALFANQSVLTTAVPEPTSGLLMLVGLAGLALRRRRA